MSFVVCADADSLEGHSVLMLSCTADERFALYYSLDLDLPESIVHLRDELECMLHSGMQYPPALALVREELSIRSFDDAEQFLEAMESRLRHHLARQIEDGFILGQGAQEGRSELTGSDFRWVVGTYEGRLRWVSTDYFITLCDPSCFRNSDALLSHFEKRF